MENIICNASEAMPLGGQISIGTEKKAEKGKLSCSVCHSRIKGEWAVLTVIDGGSGIGEREISRIFEPFYSTRSFGAGLGLSQTSGIISQHGGHIVVESSSGRGTKMKIYLPLRDPSDQEKRKQESSTGDGGREKIFF